MPLCEWEKTITCPYNPSHQITVERIQWHLVKCRKNHPTSDHVVCPYNASHHVPKPEQQYHISICSDRKIVELSKYSWAMERPGHHGNLTMPPPSNIQWGNTAVDDMEENWEKEATVKQSYDPKKKASKAPVLRYVQGATPSQRREFRAKEKVRLEAMQQGGLDDSMNSSRDTSKDEKAMTRPSFLRRDSATAPLGPLRRPSIGVQADGGSSRPGSVTSALLAATLGRGGVGQSGKMPAIGNCPTRRPGFVPPQQGSSCTMDTESVGRGRGGVGKSGKMTAIGRCPGPGKIPRHGEVGGYTNTTRDTESVGELDTTTDTLDARLSQLALGRGRGLLQQIPLRRPSGLGRM